MALADIECHRAIYVAAGNPTLVDMWAMISSKMLILIGLTLYETEPSAVYESHRRLLALIVSGDVEAVKQALAPPRQRGAGDPQARPAKTDGRRRDLSRWSGHRERSRRRPWASLAFNARCADRFARRRRLGFKVPTSDLDVFGEPFPKPDSVRWELHRVRVVEATLEPGQCHTSPKSTQDLVEDSGQAVVADRWDSNGQL